MATLKEELLNVLENLKEDEFKKFQWFLKQDDTLEGFKGITVAHLENAGRQDTVDLMIQKHQDHGALQLTKKILEKINRNDLVPRLQNFKPRPKGSGAGAGAGPGPGAGPTVTPSVSADEKLLSVRTQLIDRITEPNLNKLLDKLLEQRIINDGEMEFAEKLNRAEKARALIDMVRKKRAGASSALIAALCEVDPVLSRDLNLQ